MCEWCNENGGEPIYCQDCGRLICSEFVGKIMDTCPRCENELKFYVVPERLLSHRRTQDTGWNIVISHCEACNYVSVVDKVMTDEHRNALHDTMEDLMRNSSVDRT